jgi:hypothetical protein
MSTNTFTFVKVRCVRSRYYGHEATYEATIIRRIKAGIWKTLATSRGHTTADAAEAAILKLADQRKLEVQNDRRALRQVEFRDRYGEAGED